MILHTIPGRLHLGTAHLFGSDRGWYYIITALSWLPAVISIPFFDRMYSNDWRFLRVFMWLILNNIANELFWDPIHLMKHDLYFTVFVILTEVFRKYIANILNKLFYGITDSNIFS